MKPPLPILLLSSLLVVASPSFGANAIERSDISADIGYAEVVRAGDYIYISGNVGWGKMSDAVKIAYDSLGKLLAKNGVTFADVVKENVYTTDLDALKANNNIRLPYYNGVYPAATWVQVDRLFNPDFVIEVELVVYAPQKK